MTSRSTDLRRIALDSDGKQFHPCSNTLRRQFRKTKSALSCRNTDEPCSALPLAFPMIEQEWRSTGNIDGHAVIRSGLQKRIMQLQARCNTSALYSTLRPTEAASSAEFRSEITIVDARSSVKTLYQYIRVVKSPVSAHHFPTDQKFPTPISNAESRGFSPPKDDTELFLMRK
jgi:hypothetical protein